MWPGNATGTGTVHDPTPEGGQINYIHRGPLRRIITNPRLVLALQCTLSVATIAVCQRLRLDSPDGTQFLTAIAAVVVFLSELTATRMLEAAPDAWLTRRWPGAGRLVVMLGLFGRLCLWGGAILAMIEWPAHLVADAPFVFLRPALSRLFWFGEISIVLTPVLAAVALVLWMLLVEVIVIRRRILRGVIVIIGGPILLAVISMIRYHVIIPATPAAELADTELVEVVFDPAGVPDLPSRNAWNYPRTLVVDGNSGNIFASFGATFGTQASREGARNIWQFNQATGRLRSLPSTQTRALAVDPSGPTVWAAPWHKFGLLNIDKDTFTVRNTTDMRPHVKSDVFEPLAAAILPPFLYIGLTTPPAILKIDTRNGEVVGRLDVAGPNGIPNVDVVVGIHACERTDTLFLTVEGPIHGYVVRVDPDRMQVTDHSNGILRTPWSVAATSTGPHELFVTTEHGFTTYRVDPETMEARPLFKSMPFARIAFDPWINRLVITDVRAGTISLVTRDGSIGPTFPAGTKPMALAVTREGIYVMSASGILMFNHDALGLPLCTFPSPDPDVSCTPVRGNP